MRKFFTFLGLIVRLFVSLLPFTIIDTNFFLTVLFMSITNIFPPASIIFWVWALVVAILGAQSWLTTVYYICFAVVWTPFFIFTIWAIYKDHQYNKLPKTINNDDYWRYE